MKVLKTKGVEMDEEYQAKLAGIASARKMECEQSNKISNTPEFQRLRKAMPPEFRPFSPQDSDMHAILAMIEKKEKVIIT